MKPVLRFLAGVCIAACLYSGLHAVGDQSWYSPGAGTPTASALSGVVAVANGGTSTSTALSGSSIMISNGSAIVQGAAGTSTQVLHGNAAGAPTYSAVSLSADVTGSLATSSIANGALPAGVTIATANVVSGSSLLDRNISITIDGAGSAITTGAKKIYLRVPASMALTAWEKVADQSGSCKIDVYKSTTTSIFTNGGFPPTLSIVSSSTPTITSAVISSGTTSGWTTALTKGDYLELNVISDTTITRVILTLIGLVN